LRDLLAQHLVLVLAAALVGLVLASWLLSVLGSLDSLTSIRPSGMEYRLDIRAVTFVTVLALAVGALLSLVPSRVVSRSDVQQVLRAGAPTAAASHGGIAQKIFVVAQVAVAVVLLTGAGLMGRTVWRLAGLDLGFNPAPILQGSPSFPHPWRVREKFVPVTRQIANDLALLPGATSVAIRANAPLGPRGATPRVTLEGQADPLPAGAVPQSGFSVSAGYFSPWASRSARTRVRWPRPGEHAAGRDRQPVRRGVVARAGSGRADGAGRYRGGQASRAHGGRRGSRQSRGPASLLLSIRVPSST
jgi:hypothetical protein